jgi:hypothetical protein
LRVLSAWSLVSALHSERLSRRFGQLGVSGRHPSQEVGRGHPRVGLNAFMRDLVGDRGHLDPAVAAINRPAVSFEPAMEAVGSHARVGQQPFSHDNLPVLGEAMMMKIHQQRGRDTHAVARVGRPVTKRSGEVRQSPLPVETADQLGRATVAIKAFRIRDDDSHL